MFVRVFDKKIKKYYKSMVYGLINTGYYEQAILFNPYMNCFELVEYLDKESKELRPLYEWINTEYVGWVSYDKAFLLKLNKYCKEHNYDNQIKLYRGYKEVFDDFGFMLKILKERNVPLSQTEIEVKSNKDVDEWNYIRTQEDADEFMKLFAGFHDSTLDKMIYEEDYGKRKLKAVFDNSGWYGVVELCFEGLIKMNLHSFAENYSREIYGATLLVQNESVFWADDELDDENMDYKGTWIKALNLKWKKIK